MPPTDEASVRNAFTSVLLERYMLLDNNYTFPSPVLLIITVRETLRARDHLPELFLDLASH